MTIPYYMEIMGVDRPDRTFEPAASSSGAAEEAAGSDGDDSDSPWKCCSRLIGNAPWKCRFQHAGGCEKIGMN